MWSDRWQKPPLCLGLLSKGNRDLQTTRSLENPYAGGPLCAQRTSERLALYVKIGRPTSGRTQMNVRTGVWSYLLIPRDGRGSASRGCDVCARTE